MHICRLHLLQSFIYIYLSNEIENNIFLVDLLLCPRILECPKFEWPKFYQNALEFCRMNIVKNSNV